MKLFFFVFFALFLASSIALAGDAGEKISAEKISQLRDRIITDLDIWEPIILGVNRAIAFPWMINNDESKSRWLAIRSKVTSALEEHPDRLSEIDVKFYIAMMDSKVLANTDKCIQIYQDILSYEAESPTFFVCSSEWESVMSACYSFKGDTLEISAIETFIQKVQGKPFLNASFLCIQHLDRYPVKAGDLAAIKLAEIYIDKKQYKKAVDLLSPLLKNESDVIMFCEQDKKYGVSPEGYYIGRIVRPAIRAIQLQMKIYSDLGQVNDALEMGKYWGLRLSKDGWYGQCINRPLGDLYYSRGDKQKAGQQYKLDLDGYLTALSHRCSYLKYENKDLKWDKIQETKLWENNILKMKRDIQKCGMDVDINANEIDRIKDVCFYNDTKAKRQNKPYAILFSEESMVSSGKYFHDKMKELYNKNIKLLPRMKAEVNQLHDEFIAYATDLQKIRPNYYNKGVCDARKALANGFGHLAVEAQDIGIKKLLLEQMKEYIHPPQLTAKAIDLDNKEKENIDKLITQMVGEEKVKTPFPSPASNISSLSTSELLYVAKKLGNQNIPLAAQKSILSALAASENAALYDSYFNIIATNSNRELLRPAVRGIERLIENATIDASGKILESK